MTPERYAQVKNVFLMACSLPVEHRQDFVRDACGDDDALRESVERLLECHTEAAAVDESAAPAEAGDRPPPAAAEPPASPARVRPDPVPVPVRNLPPGSMIADRYRVVSRIGRGGMGEVFRVDDMRLRLPAALKFLSPAYARDPVWLVRLQNEVRLARAVTHPHVCRVFDIGESDGEAFLSMEYVDGEDLASLLRRIGRLPSDKAMQVARELCLGLAAAHDRGVLHRDLKPSNVMLDGRGRARVTDFGLAIAVEAVGDAEPPAGTPAYMAPEQMRGQRVTVRSDLYALGLVCYEIFTGVPAYRGTFREVLKAKEAGPPPAPSTLAQDLDPRVERVILACLELDPARRPSSATAVALALFGDDPLATLVAAGETPSPEIVASSGRAASWSQSSRIAALVTCVAMVFVGLLFSPRLHPLVRAGMERSPEALAERARELIAATCGLSEGDSESFGLGEAESMHDVPWFAAALGPRAPRYATQRAGDPVVWYRRAPERLTPRNAWRIVFGKTRVTPDDPPPERPGMITVVQDGRGRLLGLERVPSLGDAPAAGPFNWAPMLRQAGLNPEQATPVSSRLEHPLAGDPRVARLAWIADHPAGGGRTVRVEGVELSGKPLFFGVLAEPPSDDGRLPWQDPHFRRRLARLLQSGLLAALALSAIPLVHRNLRTGRADVSGARHLAVAVLVIRSVTRLLTSDYGRGFDEVTGGIILMFVGSISEAMVVWLCYLAVEPYVRRSLPKTLGTWSGLLHRPAPDARLGGDLLFGCAVGSLCSLALYSDALIPHVLGLSTVPQAYGETMAEAYDGFGGAIGYVLHVGWRSLRFAMIQLLLLALLQWLFQRRGTPARRAGRAPAALAAILFAVPLVALAGHPATAWVMVLAAVGACVWLLVARGLVSLVAAYFVCTLLIRAPLVADASAWYADVSWLLNACVLLPAIIGFYLSGRSPARL
jgi:serine/threonine-protein kinase